MSKCIESGNTLQGDYLKYYLFCFQITRNLENKLKMFFAASL